MDQQHEEYVSKNHPYTFVIFFFFLINLYSPHCQQCEIVLYRGQLGLFNYAKFEGVGFPGILVLKLDLKKYVFGQFFCL